MAYNFISVVFSEKKSRVGMKIATQFLRKKGWVLLVFKSFVRYKINLGIGSIMRPIYIYLAVFKVYPKMCLYEVSYRKEGTLQFCNIFFKAIFALVATTVPPLIAGIIFRQLV